MRNKEIKKMMASKMMQHNLRTRRLDIGHTGSKSIIHDLFKAKVDKKKRPDIKVVHSSKDPEYARMSIEDWEKKYLT